MLEQPGTVVGVEGGHAWVEVGRRSGCSACDAGTGCGAGVFGRLLQRRPVTLRLDNHIGAPPGTTVSVGIPERLFLRLVSRLYMLPLLAGLAGAAIGHHVAAKAFTGGLVDAAALAGALLGLVAALPRSKRYAERLTDGALSLTATGLQTGCRDTGPPGHHATATVASDSNREEVTQ